MRARVRKNFMSASVFPSEYKMESQRERCSLHRDMSTDRTCCREVHDSRCSSSKLCTDDPLHTTNYKRCRRAHSQCNPDSLLLGCLESQQAHDPEKGDEPKRVVLKGSRGKQLLNGGIHNYDSCVDHVDRRIQELWR